MEKRRLRKRVRGMPAESPPVWLPDGWTVEVRNTRNGKYRYYRSPASGCTFQSKEEVLRHLGVIKHDNGRSGRASCSNESKKQLAEEMKKSLECQPSGSISEIKTRRSGKTAGQTYKSPDSAKKWKPQPTGKKHHLIGDLNETATAPDRLLQPPSSQENVELMPEEENAPESATLSPPCPRNTRERTAKNGRIPASKCTRKSNISNKKARFESKENIELEKVTERPSDPSDQTLMDSQSDGKKIAKRTEDEAHKGRESKPESATKSKENSKEEDEVMLRVDHATDKFPLASNETSKDLLGDEMKLIMASQRTSIEKVNFVDPQNNNLSEVEKELPVVVRNPSTPDLVKPKHGSRKTNAMNAISRPQRSSRRLAYVEVDVATDIDMGGERPHESKSKSTAIDMLENSHQRENEVGGAASTTGSVQRLQNTMEEGAATVMNQATMDWTDFSSTSPFGDSWLDPCLEFAFKTLTGDLPVLDDAIAIQEYFQQHVFVVEGSTSPVVLAPVSNNKAVAALVSDEAEIKLPNEQDVQVRCKPDVMEKK